MHWTSRNYQLITIFNETHQISISMTSYGNLVVLFLTGEGKEQQQHHHHHHHRPANHTLKRQWSMLSCTSLKASRTFLRSRAWSSFVSDTILARSSSTPSHLIVPLPPPQPRSMAETNESKRPTVMQYNGQMQPRRKVKERDQIDDERRNRLPLVTNSRKETVESRFVPPKRPQQL